MIIYERIILNYHKTVVIQILVLEKYIPPLKKYVLVLLLSGNLLDVVVNLTQLVKTMYNICKVQVQTLYTTKKKTVRRQKKKLGESESFG